MNNKFKKGDYIIQISKSHSQEKINKVTKVNNILNEWVFTGLINLSRNKNRFRHATDLEICIAKLKGEIN